MGRRINAKDRIIQKSVGFKFRQIEFLNWCDEQGIMEIEGLRIAFKPDPYMRHAMDEQIKKIAEYYPDAERFL